MKNCKFATHKNSSPTPKVFTQGFHLIQLFSQAVAGTFNGDDCTMMHQLINGLLCSPCVMEFRPIREWPVTRDDDASLLIPSRNPPHCRAIAKWQGFLDHPQHLDERAVLVGHVAFENLLNVIGNAEQHLATAKDLCYASHGPTLLLCVCDKSHYKELSGPFPNILANLGLF